MIDVDKVLTKEELNDNIKELTESIEYIDKERQTYLTLKKQLQRSLNVVNKKTKEYDMSINEIQKDKENLEYCKTIIESLKQYEDKQVGQGHINPVVKQILENYGYKVTNYMHNNHLADGSIVQEPSYEIKKMYDMQVYTRR